jgi:hypothetical protein
MVELGEFMAPASTTNPYSTRHTLTTVDCSVQEPLEAVVQTGPTKAQSSGSGVSRARANPTELLYWAARTDSTPKMRSCLAAARLTINDRRSTGSGHSDLVLSAYWLPALARLIRPLSCNNPACRVCSMLSVTPPVVASAILVECRSGWRLKVTFMDGKAVDKDTYSTREDALLALHHLFLRQDRAPKLQS